MVRTSVAAGKKNAPKEKEPQGNQPEEAPPASSRARKDKGKGVADGQSSKAAGKRPMVEKAAKPKGKGKAVEKESLNKEPSTREYMELFEKCKFHGTRYPCSSTTRTLGIYTDTKRIFDNMGVLGFMERAYPTYKHLTCQFLSTLKVIGYRESELSSGDGWISFRIGKQKFSATFYELEKALGLVIYPQKKDNFKIDRVQHQKLWSVIGSRNFTSGVTRNQHLKHPAVRYAHKALANTFYARKETSAISLKERDFLYNALYEIVEAEGVTLGSPKKHPCIVTMLMEHLESYKGWIWSMGGKGKTPQIFIGGVVTAIMMASGVNLDGYDGEMVEPTWIDVPYLKKSKYLGKNTRDGYIYRFLTEAGEPASIILPSPRGISLMERGNIYFRPAPAQLYLGASATEEDEEEREINEEGEAGEEAPEGAGNEGYEESQEEELDENELLNYSTREFHFKPLEAPRQGSPLEAAHAHINTLQKWCKKQDKTIKKLVSLFKGKFRNKTTSREASHQSYGQEYTANNEEPLPPAEPTEEEEAIWNPQGRHSFHVAPADQWGPWEPSRASSFEPRAQPPSAWDAHPHTTSEGITTWQTWDAQGIATQNQAQWTGWTPSQQEPATSSQTRRRKNKRRASQSPQQTNSGSFQEPGETEEICSTSHHSTDHN